MMASIELSEGFQSAVPFLMANAMATAQHDAILAALEAQGVELSASDVDALFELLSSQQARMHAVSLILTRRRCKRTLDMLPVSTRLLRERCHELWRGYLSSQAAHSVSPGSVADSIAFGAWVVNALGPASIEAQLVRFELRRNAVMVDMKRRRNEGTAPTRPRLSEEGFVRLAASARMERFESAADLAMAHFLKTQAVSREIPSTPVWLLFHPARGGKDVTVTRLSATLASILSGAAEPVSVREVLRTIDEARRLTVRSALARLTQLGVLELSG